MAKAIVLREYGNSDVLKLEDIKIKKPKENELLIRQTAIGVHFHDIYVRSGLYKTLELPGIPGLEAVGIIEETGASIEDFKNCLLYTSPSPRDLYRSRMPSSA